MCDHDDPGSAKVVAARTYRVSRIFAVAARLPRQHYAATDIDIDAAHLVALATSIALAIYGDHAARQLGVPTEELRARARVLLERMFESVVPTPPV
jgi:hypothetical protein